ncbi:transposase [Rickettsiales endosymbiont of Peranema trichophorum]|uniref:IS66 family insertion sequence element accessory protein TnpB n=1 Tax=Rickettsiales endosymbiont of Peranema trichophorum TaxID=2486577 RepID=UPI0010239C47|nr:IS66 family insertion sequence element accessory protein TnpB [Rickettsiales endosymbiont of Peranema trichophorum]RZI47181.1 transposase [Rickettsiales endosymbiont of Peranema trichophorum]
MFDHNTSKIYLCTGFTDMRKGINRLTLLVSGLVTDQVCSGAMFVFRGKNAHKLKILWWDGQGYCLFYKCLDSGKFTWPKSDENGSLGSLIANQSSRVRKNKCVS